MGKRLGFSDCWIFFPVSRVSWRLCFRFLREQTVIVSCFLLVRAVILPCLLRVLAVIVCCFLHEQAGRLNAQWRCYHEARQGHVERLMATVASMQVRQPSTSPSAAGGPKVVYVQLGFCAHSLPSCCSHGIIEILLQLLSLTETLRICNLTTSNSF